MPVIVEAISAIIRRRAISENYPASYPAFEQEAPTMGPVDTLCADDENSAVASMRPGPCSHGCQYRRPPWFSGCTPSRSR
jgi:hypothetical protein